MKRRKNFPVILSLSSMLLFCNLTFAQNEKAIDSLKKVLGTAMIDTLRVTTLNATTKQFLDIEQYDSALKYSNEAIALSETISFKEGNSAALSDKGVALRSIGNYAGAMSCFEAELKVNREIGDEKAIANSYNQIANTYHLQGDFPNALKNQYMALKIREKIGDKQGIAWSYNNIGIIQRLQGNYQEALKNYFASLKLLEEFGNKKAIATAYNNIGNIYSEQKDFKSALDNYFSSLRIRMSVGDKREIGASYNNIGDVFCDLYENDSVNKEIRIFYSENDERIIKQKYWLDTALALQSRALKINREIDDKYFSIFSMSGIGRINFIRKNYAESIKWYEKAYEIAVIMNAVDLEKEIAKYLADNYNNLHDYKNGMAWYVKYTAHKDSLFNEEKTQDLTSTQMKYEFEKKEGVAKAEQEKKDALSAAELSKQKKMRNIFVGGFALVFIFAGIFFYQRNHIKREKGRSDKLLLNILPSEIATELKQTGSAKTKQFDVVTVMFADFVDFTKVSEKISPELLVEEIHTCFSAFDFILQKHKVEKIKTIGDAYLCAGGIPVPDPDHALHVANAAIEIKNFMVQRKKDKEQKNEISFELRIGIHTGSVVAGIVGVKKYAYDIWGDTVNIAARLEQNSERGKINISSATYLLLKDKFKCTYRGKVEAKNKGEIDMYFLEE